MAIGRYESGWRLKRRGGGLFFKNRGGRRDGRLETLLIK